MKHHAWVWLTLLCGGGLSQAQSAAPPAFPYHLPDQKPDLPLSVAMERLYEDYLAPTPEANELYSTFKFTPLEGLDYQNGDGHASKALWLLRACFPMPAKFPEELPSSAR